MDALSLFIERFPSVETERDFSFAKHTTIGCGGTALFAVSPPDIDCAAECIGFLEEEGIPHVFLGAGANVLPKDGRFDGAVVRFNRMKSLVSDGKYIYADAGVTGGELVAFARAHSIGGYEVFTGIPMTVGGAVAMNAGVAEGHIGDLVLSVHACVYGRVREFSHEECNFSLKNSVFLRGIAVLGVALRAEYSDPKRIREEIALFSERRKRLPKGKSMGCTFVNPEGVSAGELIDRCGLKGRSVGKAFVSDRHANFIINGGASSEEIARLIEEVQNEVYRKTGIMLREEIRRIP